MSKLVFKPEDFLRAGRFEVGHWTPQSTSEMANTAQAKFDQWLKENGRVIYRDSEPDHFWFEDKEALGRPTYKAILINIEPIEKCTHPTGKVSGHYLSDGIYDKWIGYRCECGVKVKPKEFEVVD